MPNKINLGQCMEFYFALTNQGPNAMYRLFANEGYRYARLAMGVAEQNTLSGVVALSYMKSTGAAMGKSTDDEVVNRILNDMALAYLNAMVTQYGVDLTPISRELDYQEAWAFHNTIFDQYGYGRDAWTLNSVFEVLGTDQNRQAYWQQVLASAGNTEAELRLAADTYVLMRKASLDGNTQQQKYAQGWLTRIESLDTVIAADQVGTQLYRDFLNETLDSVSKRFEGIYNSLFGVVPQAVPVPASSSVPVPAPTRPPVRHRPRKHRGRPGPTTGRGHPDSGHNGGGGGSGGGGVITIHN